ncbi:NlpC/P60 family protein [Kineococcus sp. SYSU DK004]|uniref:NlpC/P60 family protein n=1 Tax=Kineococcus sp. SYSU DK004 TaxID=3383125 RepID=UPI003D7E8430
MSGIAEVQSRIADIESRIAGLGAAAGQQRLLTAATAVRAASSAAASASSGDGGFASALGGATGATGGVARGTRSLNAAFGGRAVADPTTAAGGDTGERLLAAARPYLGVPYVWGGTTPAGFDCSGLIQYAAKQVGVSLPRTAAQQAKVGTEVASLTDARPGDLVVLSGGSHIGIYVGDGKMLHAPKPGDVVKIAKVWETPMTIRRLGTTAATTAAAGLAAAAVFTGVGGAPATTGAGYVRPPALTGASAASAPYDAAFRAAEQRYSLPAGLLSAVAKAESGYDPNARSRAGALGLMQFMPATAREMGVDPLDPASAIDGAGRLLRKHLDAFGSVPLALAAYNAGPGNVRKHGGVPPFAETQKYVQKITATLNAWSAA